MIKSSINLLYREHTFEHTILRFSILNVCEFHRHIRSLGKEKSSYIEGNICTF